MTGRGIVLTAIAVLLLSAAWTLSRRKREAAPSFKAWYPQK